MNNDLQSYITEARKLGHSDSTVRANLLSAGWLEKDIATVLPQQDLPIPQPTTSAAREVFMYVVSALLPPFGLVWAFKFLRNKTDQGRRIGIIIIIVTAISLAINIWVLVAFYSKYFELLLSITEI